MALLSAIVLLLALFLASPLPCAAETSPDPAIRAIRGPVPPSGLPPFAVTSFVLIGIGSIVWYRRRKAVHAPAVSEPPGDSVSPRALVALLLEEARRRQCHPAEIVERLTPILRSHLAAESGTSAEHCTSQELIAMLQRTGEAEVLLHASRLLHLCDSVRFGGVVPTFEQAEWALQGTLLLIDNHNESISYNTGKNALYFPPPLGPRGSLQGEGWGGDGVDCGVPVNKQDINHPHPHPNLPFMPQRVPEGEGTKGFGGLS